MRVERVSGIVGVEAMNSPVTGKVRVTQIKSSIGRLKAHKACVAGLGLRRIGHTVEVEDTAAVRGMIARVHYLVKVEGE
jgi:large subunit ribosomal protein L30